MTATKPRRSPLKMALHLPFLRNILLLTLLSVVLLPLYSLLISHPQYEQLLVRITADEAARVARHLSQVLHEDGADILQGQLPEGFAEHIQHIQSDFKLEKVKVFSRDGIVVYSTETKDLGSRNEHPYFRDVVAQGQVFTKVVHKESRTAENQIAAKDVVETYQPIMIQGRFLGAFELYYDITDRLVQMDRLLHSTLLQKIGMVLLFACAMLLVLLRAVRALDERDQAQQALQASEARFRSMSASAQDGIVEMDCEGRISYWNHAATRIFGFSEAEALGQSLHSLITPQRFRSAFHGQFGSFQKTGEGRFIGKTTELVGLDKFGHELPVEISIASIRESEGFRTIGVIRDIRQRKEAEQGLRLGSSVIRQASEGIIVTDAKGNISMVNPAFSRVTGYSESEAIGANPKLLGSGRHDDEFYARMWASLLEHGYWQGEVWNRRKNGEVFPEWLSLSAIHDSEGHITNFVGMFSDISKLKEAEEDLERLAFYDPLTALPNRLLFRERLEHSLKAARRSSSKLTAVLYLDLDKFKPVNDTYGHTTGDALLQEVGRRLSESVREVDTVARLGGDEFAIVLHEVTDASIPQVIANKIIAAINEPMLVEGNNCHVGTSIGIAIAPEHTTDASTLVELADAAMYVAKNAAATAVTRTTAREGKRHLERANAPQLRKH
jgi:diguanylate cyclase (GGDEF)-like protein/PAS domain S-box-containing protein